MKPSWRECRKALLAAAKARAEAKEQEGATLLTRYPERHLPVTDLLRQPCVARRDVSRLFHCQVPSDQGPNAVARDNSPVMEEICAAPANWRNCWASENYAHESLATKMAGKSAAGALDLTDLAKRARPQGRKKSWPSCAPSPKPNLALRSCNRGISRTTVKSKTVPVQHQR